MANHLIRRQLKLASEQYIDRLEAENERLRALIEDACKVFDHYDLPEHALYYRRKLVQGGGDARMAGY